MNLFKWLINDLKEDFKTVKELGRGEYKSKYTLKQLFTVDWRKMIKEYGLFFIIIILAFCMGYFYATQRLQDACNQFIINNDLIIRPVYEKTLYIAQNITEKIIIY